MKPGLRVGTDRVLLGLFLLALAAQASETRADSAASSTAEQSNSEHETPLATHLRDRGTGVATSVPGAYVREGEVLAYSWIAYGGDRDYQYDPREFGFASEGEFIGRYQAHEANAWVAYGLRDDMVLEFQAGGMQASLQKAGDDATGMPTELKESGLGNVRTRLDWRILSESERRPEIFTFATLAIPHNKRRVLTGTNNWLVDLGIGAVRGYRWGTFTLRSSMEFDLSSASVGDWGEVTLEYFKRLSPRVSVVSAVAILQGDEGSLFGEFQWQPTQHVVLKLGGAQALSSNGLDWSAQAGVLYKFAER